MNVRNAAFWATTSLTSLALAAGGLGQLTASPEMMTSFAKLGYPAYLMSLLGAWKVLGALAIAVPRFARLKELAYAGVLFLTTGAAYSHAMSGDPAGKIVPPLVILALATASYVLRPASRIVGAPLVSDAPIKTPRVAAVTG